MAQLAPLEHLFHESAQHYEQYRRQQLEVRKLQHVHSMLLHFHQ
jgi:hypothetical protein